MTTEPIVRGQEHPDAPLSYDGDHCQRCGAETLAEPHRPSDPRRRVIFPGAEANVESGPSEREIPVVVCGACDVALDEEEAAEITDEYLAGRDVPDFSGPPAALTTCPVHGLQLLLHEQDVVSPSGDPVWVMGLECGHVVAEIAPSDFRLVTLMGTLVEGPVAMTVTEPADQWVMLCGLMGEAERHDSGETPAEGHDRRERAERLAHGLSQHLRTEHPRWYSDQIHGQHHRRWVYEEGTDEGDASRCEICGEPLDGRGNGTAEMYDPTATAQPAPSLIVHADCGLGRGMEVA